MSERHAMGECYLEWDDEAIQIGTGRMERTWDLGGGLLHPSSIRRVDLDREWYFGVSSVPIPYPPFPVDTDRDITVSFREGRILPAARKSLVVNVESRGRFSKLVYRMMAFEGAPGLSMQLEAFPRGKGHPGPSPDLTGDEDLPLMDCTEDLNLDPRHVRVRQVELMDQTDKHDELVFEREWLLQPNEEDLALKGNLFVVEDVISQAGLVFMKHAPLPWARPVKCPFDLKVRSRSASYHPSEDEDSRSKHLPYRCRFFGHGIPPRGGKGYWYSLISYEGGDPGVTEALQTYQSYYRAYLPGRDGQFLSNTWGDRSRDRRLNEEFILKEIDAGKELGVDVVQIDDGWQRGISTNTSSQGVWQGFWDFDENYWDPDPEKFPRGLGPLCVAAQERDMEVGLWFAPDSLNHFEDWERDADRVLEIYDEFGIRFFKIDGVKARTKEGERNLHRLFRKVLDGSRGRVSFDLDVTAEVRPGYLGSIGTGPVFVENRYTDYHRYWPHQTLRNLWKLSRYIHPFRLRMEFLNNQRNQDLYADDPLSPAQYDPDYLFASVMFSNPLGWFEVSNLPEDYFRDIPPLVSVWKEKRDEIYTGRVLPIGNPPDGRSWTGFLSLNPERDSALLLVFRELSPRPKWATMLRMLPRPDMDCRVLAGNGRLELHGKRLEVIMDSELSYLFAELK